LKKKYLHILFILLGGVLSVNAQVKFDSEDPMWMSNNGLAQVSIFESYKDALKKKNDVYKLSCVNELIGNQAPKLSKLVNLQLLNLQNNGITSISADWALLSNMYIMVSKKNPIQYIDPAFAANSNLLYLEMFDTKLDSLPREIAYMGRLELFRLISNSTDTLRISDSIKRMVNLKEIMIADANLYNFPAFICRSKKLECVSLINCKVDSVPLEIQWMEKLKILNLEGNNIKEIPYWIKYCKNLEVLILKNNKIDNFSEWIATLPKLEFMDITDNQLSLPDLDILKVLFKNRSGKVLSDYEKLLKERYGEQKLKE
jgi:Leucine-rich repeat (LRR) protein